MTDSIEASDLLKEALGPYCKVTCRDTVLSALQELKDILPDLVVVQVGLRSESCFDFLKPAQLATAARLIPMIAFSAENHFHESIESFLRKACLFFGCLGYLKADEFRSSELGLELAKHLRDRSLCRAS